MYDRATRALTQPATGTSFQVGPGTYNANIGGFDAKRKVDGYAPFCSMSMRPSFLEVKKEMNNPGPGSFEPEIQDHVKGASTLANKAQRFQESFDETPGPGSYDLSKPSDWVKHAPIQCNYDAQSNLHPLCANRVLAPPSIPSPGKSFGYEEGNDGTLRRQKVPEKDTTLGPAFYCVKDEETKAVRKYKGIHFGQMKSKRNREVKGEDTPAPGCYDPYVPNWGKTTPEKKSESKPIISKLPRYHEIVTILENKKAVPGPGHYEIKSQFEKSSTSNNEASLRPSFGSQAKRFTDSKEQTPAPASYNDPRHALEILNRICGLKKSPFGQTATRFTREHHVRRTPGPGTYYYSDLATELQKKALFSRTRKGGFGSTAVRELPLNRQNEGEFPGPSEYVVKAPQDGRNKKRQAVFKSTTNRLMNTRGDGPAPPPGSYEVSRSFDNTQGKNLSVEQCRTIRAKNINGGFLSSTKRFSQPRDIIVKKTDIMNPGPGNYDVKKPLIPGGYMVSREERFKEVKSDIPGPGTYQLSPLIQHSVLKSTFNATLNNPVTYLMEGDARANTASNNFFVNVNG